MAVFEEFLEVYTPHLSEYPQWQVGEEGENGIRREGEVGKTLTVSSTHMATYPCMLTEVGSGVEEM